MPVVTALLFLFVFRRIQQRYKKQTIEQRVTLAETTIAVIATPDILSWSLSPLDPLEPLLPPFYLSLVSEDDGSTFSSSP